MTQSSEPLSFDRAEYADQAAAGARCNACSSPIEGEYWRLGQQVICERCRGGVLEVMARGQSGGAFGKAVLLGGATALGCGIAYAIFVALTDFQLALVTIGIAFVIAKVVRKASGGMSGRKFQVLAVVLTYFASALGYFPGVWSGLRESSAQHAGPTSAPAGADPKSPSDSNGAPATAPERPPSAGQVALAVGLVVAFTLAMPVLAAKEAPIGLLIVLFGLWEAWKLSRPLQLAVEGPFRMAPNATGPPSE